jgi:hypothetical protein
MWRDWPRGLGAWPWSMTQEFDSPIPPQRCGGMVLIGNTLGLHPRVVGS